MKICFKDFRSGYKEIVVKEGPPACRTAKDGGAGACALIRKIVTRFVFVVIKKKEIVTRKNGRVLKLLIFEFHLCYRHTLLISLLYLLLFFYFSILLYFLYFFFTFVAFLICLKLVEQLVNQPGRELNC